MTTEATPTGAPAFGSTVTIFFSDIRGFTEFTDVYGDESAYRMLRLHNALVQEKFALYRGHVVKTQGDSFMVSFDSARTAVTCAIAIQKAVADANRERGGAGIQIGIGINTGEPVREGSDFFGGTVNLAARICAVAEPGQVLVSETVRAVTGKMEGRSFVDRGAFELKGFREPQRLYEVVDALEANPEVAVAIEAATFKPTTKPVSPIKPTLASPAPPADATASRAGAWGWLVPAIAGLLVVVFGGAGIYALLHRGGGGAASTASNSMPHGKLLYQAHAAADTWSASSPPKPDPAGSAGVSYSGSTINLDILKPGGNLGGELEAPALKDFAAQLVISASPGSDLEINWWLRGTTDSGLDLHFDLPTETMSLVYNPNTGGSEVLVKDARLPGLQSGRRMTIGIVADGTRLSLYLNGARVANVVESRANGGTTPGFFMDGRSGSFHLESVRYYAVS